MSTKSVFLSLPFLLALLHSAIASAGTCHVNKAATEPRDGLSLETGFEKIQEGIDASSDGDTVIVAEGTYIENIHFNGKNIIARSTDPLDPDIIARAVIDSSRDDPAVTFSGSEDQTCVISGSTITNGSPGVLGGT